MEGYSAGWNSALVPKLGFSLMSHIVSAGSCSGCLPIVVEMEQNLSILFHFLSGQATA